MAKATKVKLFITEERMLDVMKHCVDNNIQDIGTNADWCRAIGFEPTNLDNVKKGLRGFTKEHIVSAGKRFNVSMEFIYGFSTDMFRMKAKKTAIQQLKEAVKAVELDFSAMTADNLSKNKKK